MKQNKRPSEEKAIIPDRNYIICFVVGFAIGVLAAIFIMVLIRSRA